MELKPEKKKKGLNKIQTHDFCDTGAVIYQLSYHANWDLWIASGEQSRKIVDFSDFNFIILFFHFQKCIISLRGVYPN